MIQQQNQIIKREANPFEKGLTATLRISEAGLTGYAVLALYKSHREINN
jgi:hypothetical protein